MKFDSTLQVRYRGPNNDVSAFVLFDSISIADAVPVELMEFSVE